MRSTPQEMNSRKARFASGSGGGGGDTRRKQRRTFQRSSGGVQQDDNNVASVSSFIQGQCMEMCHPDEAREREADRDLAKFECYPSSLQNGPRRVDLALAVKKYKRPAAGKKFDPQRVRPPPVLLKSLRYLINNIVDQTDHPRIDGYKFVADRMRAIRQGFVCQGTNDTLTVRSHEWMARFHIIAAHEFCELKFEDYDPHQNMTKLTQTMRSLLQYYDDTYAKLGHKNIRQARFVCMNESEIRGFDLLTQLHKPDFMSLVASVPSRCMDSPDIKFAVAVKIALVTSNHEAFLKLMDRASYLQGCLIFNALEQYRVDTLFVLKRAYIKLPLTFLRSRLLFDTCAECATFLRRVGFSLSKGRAGADMSDAEVDVRAVEIELRKVSMRHPQNAEKRVSQLLLRKRLGLSNKRLMIEDSCPPGCKFFDAQQIKAPQKIKLRRVLRNKGGERVSMRLKTGIVGLSRDGSEMQDETVDLAALNEWDPEEDNESESEPGMAAAAPVERKLNVEAAPFVPASYGTQDDTQMDDNCPGYGQQDAEDESDGSDGGDGDGAWSDDGDNQSTAQEDTEQESRGESAAAVPNLRFTVRRRPVPVTPSDSSETEQQTASAGGATWGAAASDGAQMGFRKKQQPKGRVTQWGTNKIGFKRTPSTFWGGKSSHRKKSPSPESAFAPRMKTQSDSRKNKQTQVSPGAESMGVAESRTRAVRDFFQSAQSSTPSPKTPAKPPSVHVGVPSRSGGFTLPANISLASPNEEKLKRGRSEASLSSSSGADEPPSRPSLQVTLPPELSSRTRTEPSSKPKSKPATPVGSGFKFPAVSDDSQPKQPDFQFAVSEPSAQSPAGTGGEIAAAPASFSFASGDQDEGPDGTASSHTASKESADVPSQPTTSLTLKPPRLARPDHLSVSWSARTGPSGPLTDTIDAKEGSRRHKQLQRRRKYFTKRMLSIERRFRAPIALDLLSSDSEGDESDNGMQSEGGSDTEGTEGSQKAAPSTEMGNLDDLTLQSPLTRVGSTEIRRFQAASSPYVPSGGSSAQNDRPHGKFPRLVSVEAYPQRDVTTRQIAESDVEETGTVGSIMEWYPLEQEMSSLTLPFITRCLQRQPDKGHAAAEARCVEWHQALLQPSRRSKTTVPARVRRVLNLLGCTPNFVKDGAWALQMLAQWKERQGLLRPRSYMAAVVSAPGVRMMRLSSHLWDQHLKMVRVSPEQHHGDWILQALSTICSDNTRPAIFRAVTQEASHGSRQLLGRWSRLEVGLLQVARDPSAWEHLCAEPDKEQAAGYSKQAVSLSSTDPLASLGALGLREDVQSPPRTPAAATPGKMRGLRSTLAAISLQGPESSWDRTDQSCELASTVVGLFGSSSRVASDNTPKNASCCAVQFCQNDDSVSRLVQEGSCWHQCNANGIQRISAMDALLTSLSFDVASESKIGGTSSHGQINLSLHLDGQYGAEDALPLPFQCGVFVLPATVTVHIAPSNGQTVISVDWEDMPDDEVKRYDLQFSQLCERYASLAAAGQKWPVCVMYRVAVMTSPLQDPARQFDLQSQSADMQQTVQCCNEFVADTYLATLRDIASKRGKKWNRRVDVCAQPFDVDALQWNAASIGISGLRQLTRGIPANPLMYKWHLPRFTRRFFDASCKRARALINDKSVLEAVSPMCLPSFVASYLNASCEVLLDALSSKYVPSRAQCLWPPLLPSGEYSSTLSKVKDGFVPSAFFPCLDELKLHIASSWDKSQSVNLQDWMPFYHSLYPPFVTHTASSTPHSSNSLAQLVSSNLRNQPTRRATASTWQSWGAMQPNFREGMLSHALPPLIWNAAGRRAQVFGSLRLVQAVLRTLQWDGLRVGEHKVGDPDAVEVSRWVVGACIGMYAVSCAWWSIPIPQRLLRFVSANAVASGTSCLHTVWAQHLGIGVPPGLHRVLEKAVRATDMESNRDLSFAQLWSSVERAAQGIPLLSSCLLYMKSLVRSMRGASFAQSLGPLTTFLVRFAVLVSFDARVLLHGSPRPDPRTPTSATTIGSCCDHQPAVQQSKNPAFVYWPTQHICQACMWRVTQSPVFALASSEHIIGRVTEALYHQVQGAPQNLLQSVSRVVKRAAGQLRRRPRKNKRARSPGTSRGGTDFPRWQIPQAPLSPSTPSLVPSSFGSVGDRLPKKRRLGQEPVWGEGASSTVPPSPWTSLRTPLTLGDITSPLYVVSEDNGPPGSATGGESKRPDIMPAFLTTPIGLVKTPRDQLDFAGRVASEKDRLSVLAQCMARLETMLDPEE